MQLHDLIGEVDYDRDEKNFADVPPPVSKMMSPPGRIAQDRPAIGAAALAAIFHPSANRKKGGHRRLHNQPNGSGPPIRPIRLAHTRASIASTAFSSLQEEAAREPSLDQGGGTQ